MIKSLKKRNIKARMSFFVRHMSNDQNPMPINVFMNDFFPREKSCIFKAKGNLNRAIVEYSK